MINRDRVDTRIHWSHHRHALLGHATWHLYRKVLP
jgi:hypothetical protein